MKLIIEGIVKIIISFLKDLFFKAKKEMLDKSIEKSKAEAKNVIKKADESYTTFRDMYDDYMSSETGVRHGTEEVRGDGGDSEGSDTESAGSDSEAGPKS